MARGLTLALRFAGGGTWEKTRRLAEASAHDNDLRTVAYRLIDAVGLQRGRITALTLRGEDLVPAEQVGLDVFFVGGGLGSFLYVATTHRLDEMPWSGLLFGAIVCATLSALFPGRRRGWVSLSARTNPSSCGAEVGVLPSGASQADAGGRAGRSRPRGTRTRAGLPRRPAPRTGGCGPGPDGSASRGDGDPAGAVPELRASGSGRDGNSRRPGSCGFPVAGSVCRSDREMMPSSTVVSGRQTGVERERPGRRGRGPGRCAGAGGRVVRRSRARTGPT
ncbi:hypothetical protein ABZT03_32660 [Streptomyces sp. NPDC005574]|uniref:DinB/UmuC family translesion DNA polymerase n=1 Tax=Streptomyces sp. NPDC005574 TaxID=3156891 RepID=UPI0033A3525D